MKTLDDYKDDVCEALGCDDRSDLHREHVSGCYDVEKLLEARDAEHRAELDAEHRTIEQLGKDAAAMAEKLDRAVMVLRECVAMMRIQEKRSSGEFHLSAEAFVPMWSSSLDAADKFLAAPPPAESTPVHEYVSSRTGACMECGKAIGERPPHLPKPAPPDDIRARLDDHERRLAALEAKGEPGTHAFRCQDRHPKDRADCKTEGFDCVCDCGAKRNEHPKGAKP